MRLFKIQFSVLLLLVFSSSAFAKSHIQLNFAGAEGRKAVVWTYKDLISLERRIVSKSTIDSNGNFAFDVYNSQVQKYFVEVRYFRIAFYIEPKKDYKIKFDKVDFNNREYYPKNVVGYLVPNYKILKPSQPELNYELDSLNLLFDNFVNENHVRLRMGNKSWQLVDTLELEVNDYLDRHPKVFLKLSVFMFLEI